MHTPIADCFLDGITRRTVIDLAKQRGIEVVERRIMPDELASFNECFLCGTGAEVTPVAEIGPYRFTPGNISRTLIEDYAAAVRPFQHLIVGTVKGGARIDRLTTTRPAEAQESSEAISRSRACCGPRMHVPASVKYFVSSPSATVGMQVGVQE